MKRRNYQWLIRFIGLIVPQRLRADWRQEWEAELRWRESQLAQWDKLDGRNKLELLWRSLGALADALALQPRRWEDEMIQDIRYALRMLLKAPGATLVILLSLTLGIVANATIFSAVNALLLVPAPVQQPETLHQIWRTNRPDKPTAKPFRVTTYPALQFLREHQQSFAVMGATFIEPENVTWNRAGEGVPLQALTVSGNYFELCGVQPVLGRAFLPDEDATAGSHPVAVISHSFWQNKLGGITDVVGQTLSINGTPLTVVGVAPPKFTSAIGVVAPDLWLPYAIAGTVFRNPDRLTSHERNSNIGLGRLKAGVSVAQAESELSGLMRRLEETHPKDYESAAVGLLPSLAVPAPARGMIAGFTGILMVAVFLVLLIACANTTNLLLARAATRRAEIAMRAALGASRWRILRQLLTESVVLASLSGIVAIAGTAWLMQFVTQLVPAGLPIQMQLSLDWRVLSFVAALSLLAGLLFGLAPAWQSSRLDLNAALKSGGRESSARHSRLSRVLIAGQLAVCLVLLLAGTLCLRSLLKARELDLGFQTANRVTAAVNLRDYGYSPAETQSFYEQWRARVGALPGVQGTALISALPLGNESNGMEIAAADRAAATDAQPRAASLYQVSPGYFATMGTRLLHGREFSAADRAGAPLVAVINETAAKSLWPNVNPLGQRVLLNPATGESAEIIGIAQNGKYRSLSEEPRPAMFLSLLQRPQERVTLVAHLVGDLNLALPALRQTTRELDSRLALSRLTTLDEFLTFALFPVRTSALLLSVLGAVALVLALSGLFGVIAYSVAQRTREIGIRLALGAPQRQIVGQIVREGMWLSLIGTLAGLGGAWVLTRFLGSVLFNVSALDPLTFAVIPALLLAVTLLASYLPACRAAKIDPIIALRHE